MTAKLWLFDIDGTLVDTGGAGLRSLQEAAAELFGGPCPELDLAGSTDLGVWAGILEHFGKDSAEESPEIFFGTYLRRLEWNLMNGEFPGRVLPGVVGLLEALSRCEDVSIGLLTGNIAGGAALKVKHYGLGHHFAFGAYGCDHADRNLLGPVALARAATHTGRIYSAEDVVVVGDTPKDIACARAMGARCLAVATGRFGVEDLEAHKADRVVASLEEIGL